MFNSEEFISKCLLSIKSQLNNNIEVIIVDDGSKDLSLEICTDLISNTKGFTIIKQENSGVSIARNNGLLQSKGKYVWFVDSDDSITVGCIDKLLEILYKETFDVLFASYYKVKLNSSFRQKQKDLDVDFINGKSLDSVLAYLWGTYGGFEWAIWKNIYRRDLIIEKGIMFNKNQTMNEDGYWLFNLLVNSEEFMAINHAIYNYTIDIKTSAVHRKTTLSSYQGNFLTYTDWYDFFKKSNSFNKSKLIMVNMLATGYFNAAFTIYEIEESSRKTAINLFDKRKQIILSSGNRKYRVIYRLLIPLGSRRFLKIINLIYNLKLRIRKAL